MPRNIGIFLVCFKKEIESGENMSLFKKRLRQFKDYLEIKRNESKFSHKLVENYRDRSKKDLEYEEFLKSLVYEIDGYFNAGKTKLVIKPRGDKLHLYEKLVKDKEFNRIYKCEVKAGSDLEISMREI